MFEGTRVTVHVRGPTVDQATSRPARATVSETRTEFADLSAYDIAGDAWVVVPASVDVDGSRVNYTIVSRSYTGFADVDDARGFNGYSISFKALTDDPLVSIRDARIAPSQTTLGIEQRRVTFDDDTLFINVDGVRFTYRDTLAIELGFSIKGTRGEDFLTGGNGRDAILGGSGDDVIAGMGGNDRITGGAGADDLHGGAGADRFIFTKTSDSTVAARGRDTIFDFAPGRDRIDLSKIDANTTRGGDQDFRFIGTRAFGENAGELRYVRKASDTYVYGDVNGDGRADFAIHLDDALRLGGGDFLL